jgi:DNA-binding NarL/FixJ family response regulator
MTKDENLLLIPPAKKIVITASTSTNYVYQAKDNKCDAYLMKPVKQENLIEKLKAIGII